MTGLSYTALACYLLGAALALPGLVLAYSEVRVIGRAISHRGGRGGTDTLSTSTTSAQGAAAGAGATTLAGDSKRRWLAFVLFTSGLLVELLGNLLSLPW
jgi:hypothetical protein